MNKTREARSRCGNLVKKGTFCLYLFRGEQTDVRGSEMFTNKYVVGLAIVLLLGLAIGGLMGGLDRFLEGGIFLSSLASIPSPQFVQGKVVNIEGHFRSSEDFTLLIDEIYVVQDGSGQQHSLKLSTGATIDGEIRLGDMIFAQLSKDGFVTYLSKA